MRREEHPNIINNKEKEDGYQLSANVFQEESEMKVGPQEAAGHLSRPCGPTICLALWVV